MYNKIIQVGNLTRDIELRYSGSGTAIAKSAVATTRKFTSNGEKKEEVCFTDITFFGRSAEVANQYLRKGSKVLIEGRLQFDQWVDQNGGKRSKHSIAVESMQMLDSKSDGQQQHQNEGGQQTKQEDYRGHSGSNQANPTYSAPQQSQQQQQPSYGAPLNQQTPVQQVDINQDEIPF